MRYTDLEGKAKAEVVVEDRNIPRITVTKVTKDRVNAGTVETITHPENALPMGRNASDRKGPITSRSCAEVTHRPNHRVKVVVVGKHIRTCMRWEKG